MMLSASTRPRFSRSYPNRSTVIQIRVDRHITGAAITRWPLRSHLYPDSPGVGVHANPRCVLRIVSATQTPRVPTSSSITLSSPSTTRGEHHACHLDESDDEPRRHQDRGKKHDRENYFHLSPFLFVTDNVFYCCTHR